VQTTPLDRTATANSTARGCKVMARILAWVAVLSPQQEFDEGCLSCAVLTQQQHLSCSDTAILMLTVCFLQCETLSGRQ